MKISVAICTWNRAELLDKTLENMEKLKTNNDFSWELLIVNNNCRDNTDVVIKKYSSRLPIRRLFEPTPGLSNARNFAVNNAQGDYIIWTDDDVIVEENWLISYVSAFMKHPDAAVFGGPVDPLFEGQAPNWLLECWESVSSAYAVRDLGKQAIQFESTGPLIPFGANFAVRMQEQKQYLYDPNLGLIGNKRIMGEEVAVMRAILSSPNSEGWWVPESKVLHWCPKERQSLKYLEGYYRGHGETVTLTSNNTETSKTLFGRPRWLIRRALELYVKYVWLRTFSKHKQWIKAFIDANIAIGSLRIRN